MIELISFSHLSLYLKLFTIFLGATYAISSSLLYDGNAENYLTSHLGCYIMDGKQLSVHACVYA